MAYSKKNTICGIYKIENKINKKVYIGQSNNILKRWAEHKRKARLGNESSLLYYAIRKYGLDNFSFEILEKCEEEKLDEREEYYIKKFNSYVGLNDGWGYNLSIGGKSNRGFHPSEETRKTWSVNRKGEGNSRALPVICDGIRFGTIKECAEYYGIEKTSMQKWLNKKTSMPYEFVLKKLRYEGKEFSCLKPKHSHYVLYDEIPFNSIMEFSEYLKIPYKVLLKNIKNKEKVDYLINHSLLIDNKAIY